MNNLLGETVFGRILHLASGGRLFQPAEQRDPLMLQKYMPSKSASSETSIEEDGHGPEARKVERMKGDTEKGQDFQLIDWTENDALV